MWSILRILKVFATRLKHQDIYFLQNIDRKAKLCHMRISETVSFEMQMQIGCECTISLFILNGCSCWKILNGLLKADILRIFNMNHDIMICKHRGLVRLFHWVSCLSKLCVEGWQNFELLCYFQGQPYAWTWILIISQWGFIFYFLDIVVTSRTHPHPWYPPLTKEGKAFRRPAGIADSSLRVRADGWTMTVHGRGLRQLCSTSCPQIIPRHLTLERISQLKCRLAYKSMANPTIV